MWGISWLAEELLVSQEKLCFMHLFGFVFICEHQWMLAWGIVWSQELCKIWGVMMALPKIQFVFWYYTVSLDK